MLVTGRQDLSLVHRSAASISPEAHLTTFVFSQPLFLKFSFQGESSG